MSSCTYTESRISDTNDFTTIPHVEPLHWGSAGNVEDQSSSMPGSAEGSQFLVVENEEEPSFMSVEPLNILYYSFSKICKKYKVKKGSTDLKELFGYWTEEIGLANVNLYPGIKVINLRHAYLGANQLLALGDMLRVEKADLTRPPSRAMQQLRSMKQRPTSFSVSLLPEVLAISLRGMCLDFTVNERAKFVLPAKQLELRCLPNIKVSGNEALRYFLNAITGHPSLEALDLSHNQIGPHLLPALSKCVKGTPTLTKIKLHHTQLSESEIEFINAQCQLNKLRIENEDEQQRTELRELWHMVQVDWLRRASEKILAAYTEEAGKPADPPFDVVFSEFMPAKVPPLFQSTTPHIRVVEPPREVVEALTRFHSRRISLDTNDDSAVLQRPTTTAGATHRLDALAVGKSEKYSHMFNTPYMRYYKNNESPGVLCNEAEEILRSAFVDPHVAELTFLRGKQPCPSLPSCSSIFDATPKTSFTSRTLKRDISRSLLMKAIRRVLFPLPPKPKSLLKGISDADPNLRTAAEENYVTIVEQQERQWGYILDKLVEHMHPAYFSDGDTIYRDGELPYWLWFLPTDGEDIPLHIANRKVEVVLQSNVTPYPSPCVSSTDSSVDDIDEEEEFEKEPEMKSSVTTMVKQGEFFGDRELFGTTPLYIYQHSRLGKEALDLGLLREKYKYREGAAMLQSTTGSYNSGTYSTTMLSPSASSMYDSPRSSKNKKSKQHEILVWQIPFEVAMFYLFEPYQTFHIQAAHAVQSLPATRDLHPCIAAMLGYILHPVGFTAGDLAKRGPQDGGRRRHMIGNTEDILTTTYILEAGEYVFGALSSHGKWIEKQLCGGTVVTNSEAYNLDAKARLEQQHQHGHTDTYKPPQVLGKTPAMRQFREFKKRSRRATNSPMSTQASFATFSGSGENPQFSLALGMQASHWRYYTIRNEDWVSLPVNIRLALSSGCIVAGVKE